MMRSRVDTARGALAAVAISLAVLGVLARARAQAPAPPAAAPAPVDKNALTPPRLMAFVDAGYPEAAKATQREAAVLMQLTIGEDGFVEDASLVEPPVGDGFDELALAAARRFVFEPATRGGEPVRARIQYRYEFTYRPPPEASAPAAPTTAGLRVTLRSAENDKPIGEAEVILTSPTEAGFALRLVSNEAGEVVTDGLAPGTYEVAVGHPRFGGERHTEQLTVGEETALTYRLQPARSYEEYGAVARVKAPAREVTRRTIQREELTRVAGTRGDALLTIELLPGVGRPPFTAGVVLIRGAGPADSTVLLDGVPVPQLYHFGGLTSFINSRALDRIDFYPGNFSVRFGRAMGGIIDVGVRDPSADRRYHGVIDTNVPLDTSLLLEGPLGEKASFMVGGRRSYLGEVLKAVIPEDAFGALAAPVYWDYQGFVTYRPTPRDRLRIGAYGSSDRLDVLFANNDDDPGIQGLELGTMFHRVQLGWRHQYSPRLEHDLQISYGRTDSAFKLPPEFILDIDTNEVYLRAEWRYRMSRAVQLIVGTDSRLGNFTASYIGPSPGDFESNEQGASFEALPEVRYRKRSPVHDVSGFVELALTPIKPLRIVPGLRVDYHSLIEQYSFDPRIAAIFSVSEALRLKGGVGVFSQPPQPPQQLAGLGNPDLLYSKAIHYSAGFEWDLTEVLSFGVEGFYKSLYDRVVATDYQAAAARGLVDPPPYDNDGIGRVYGLEVSGRKQAKGRWFGFLSYTLMRSERKDHDGPWEPFVYDQTHILAVAGTVRLGRGWELGGTLRVVSGNPRTPIIGASYDQDVGAYTPDNGRPNSERNPTFRRLDVRVEKQWRWDDFRLAAYLDVQNATNSKNPEGISYSFNYKEQETIRGLILLPVIGLRGEL